MLKDTRYQLKTEIEAVMNKTIIYAGQVKGYK